MSAIRQHGNTRIIHCSCECNFYTPLYSASKYGIHYDP